MNDSPLNSPDTDEALAGLVRRARAMGLEPVCFAAGELLMREGQDNSTIYVLLRGRVQLAKTGADGAPQPLDVLGPGSLLGILSFWTGEPVFSDSRTMEKGECLRISRARFEQAVTEDGEFSRRVLHLLVANLTDRYKRVVGLNLEVAGLTRELQRERNALREAVRELRETRNQLVHREKLATMGQLLAGIAHEINNPSSALMKSVEQLGGDLPELFRDQPERLRWLRAGETSPFSGGAEGRARLEELEQTWPALGRSRCRRLARLNPEVFEWIESALREGDFHRIDEALRLFDIGSALHSIRIADDRITRLVRGLKSYSRQEESDTRDIGLARCIEDTLMVLNHRLKHYDLQVELPPLPPVPGRAGEINQILTNLLANACDATPPGKGILLRAGAAAGRVWVEVADEGSGIPPEILERIFEPNVTTKNGSGGFGLGLGLAISRDLTLQHRGTLTARNREEGGALFRLELPASKN